MVQSVDASKDRPSDPRNREVVHPVNGDPQIGNLETPINASGLGKWLINIQPGYRKGLTPFRRGFDVGVVQGLWLIIPFVKLGPLRDTDIANIAGLLSAYGLILISTTAIWLYAASQPPNPQVTVTTPNPPAELKTSAGWSEYGKGFLFGALSGSTITYFVLSNWGVIQGLFN